MKDFRTWSLDPKNIFGTLKKCWQMLQMFLVSIWQFFTSDGTKIDRTKFEWNVQKKEWKWMKSTSNVIEVNLFILGLTGNEIRIRLTQTGSQVFNDDHVVSRDHKLVLCHVILLSQVTWNLDNELTLHREFEPQTSNAEEIRRNEMALRSRSRERKK